MLQQISHNVQSAIHALQEGRFVLVHDSSKRENEVDLVVASQLITPNHVAEMRKRAGGLICVCIENGMAKNIGLQYMHDTLFSSNSFDNDLKNMIYGTTPYGDHPTFSIWINHKSARTGITDLDRAQTIRSVSSVCVTTNHQKEIFVSSFKTPGHVPLLVAKEGLLKNRQGHTELSIFLVKLAGLVPCTAICEMIDSENHAALSVENAQKYSSDNNIQFLDLSDVLDWV